MQTVTVQFVIVSSWKPTPTISFVTAAENTSSSAMADRTSSGF